MRACMSFRVSSAQDSWTLRDFLKAQGVSSGFIRKIKRMQPGITLSGEHKNTDWRVRTGDIYELPLPPEEATSVTGQRLPVKIIYESDDALAVEKPAGMAVHPTLGYPDGTLANAVVGLWESRGEKAAFRPINRLDVGTTGLVLAAKNGLAAPFLSHSAKKEYIAVVTGELPLGEGEISAPIARCDDSIIKRCVELEGKPSATRYEVLAAAHGFSLVRCIPLTGRTHQIRVHFASIGHALAGDGLYGERCAAFSRPALHCGVITFTEPRGEQVTIKSLLPADMRLFLLEKGMKARDL